ncbi:paraneoplastic antigen Ma1 homolog [Etheostoma spectabile]|uniref:paraneoplastic antigen Ma1 homolog n=1 Tax=Etheostoma spectabile TaxID=54343 RepID=UPI0013AF16F1|nr:paraneoplastic antigen Ma1 homolog [Etheostoma spectabile]
MDFQAVKAELVTELSEWCQGESLDEDQVLLAVVPQGCEIEEIEATLQTVKALGRVRVRGRRANSKLDKLTVLCEFKEKVDSMAVPLEVIHPISQEVWPIIRGSALPAPGYQPQTSTNVQGETLLTSGSAESIIRAVGDVLSRAEKSSGEGTSYRRMRIFSGTLPTPAGEETLDHWLEQAWLMVEESECSGKEKRRRIMESLRGPALAVVKAVRTAEADITPSKCLEAIESAFGTTESGEDLYFEFRLLRQEKVEKLSSFLRRIEQSLTKVVNKGAYLSVVWTLPEWSSYFEEPYTQTLC